jgi:hypothetical protein
MSMTELLQLTQLVATLVGILGGLLALKKHFSDRREKELREWQKVVVYKIFRRKEMTSVAFAEVLEKYRSEAFAFADVEIKKKEISEDALRRILLELSSSNILSLAPGDSFQLAVKVPKLDLAEKAELMSKALVQVVGSHPNLYTLDEVAKQVAEKTGFDFVLLRNDIREAIELDRLDVDDKGRLSFPQ